MTKYTAFRRDPDGEICYLDSDGPCSLQDFFSRVNSFYGDWKDVQLIAWAPESTIDYGGTKECDDLCAESIAAGRLIELRNGKYIPLGVPEEKKETPFKYGIFDACQCGYFFGDHPDGRCPRGSGMFTAFPPRKMPTPDNADMQARDVRQRAPLTWNQPSKSTRWDGYTVKSFDADALNPPAPAGWVSPDLKAVSPLCGSAHLVLWED